MYVRHILARAYMYMCYVSNYQAREVGRALVY